MGAWCGNGCDLGRGIVYGTVTGCSTLLLIAIRKGLCKRTSALGRVRSALIMSCSWLAINFSKALAEIGEPTVTDFCCTACIVSTAPNVVLSNEIWPRRIAGPFASTLFLLHCFTALMLLGLCQELGFFQPSVKIDTWEMFAYNLLFSKPCVFLVMSQPATPLPGEGH